MRAAVFYVSMNALVTSWPRPGSILSILSNQNSCSLSASFLNGLTSFWYSVFGPSKLMCWAIYSGVALIHSISLIGLGSSSRSAYCCCSWSRISIAACYSSSRYSFRCSELSSWISVTSSSIQSVMRTPRWLRTLLLLLDPAVILCLFPSLSYT